MISTKRAGVGLDLLVMFCFHGEVLFYLEECWNGINRIKNCDVGASFCKSFCECQTTASSASCDKGSATFEGELLKSETDSVESRGSANFTHLVQKCVKRLQVAEG